MTAKRLLLLFARAGKRAVQIGDAAAGAIVGLDLEGRWYGVLGGEVVSRVNPEAVPGQSASMAFAFTAGAPIAKVAVKAGMAEVFKNMPLLVFALAGGFTTNFISP